ncbi:MAG: Do family serine endopeptidase [Deltaproteobacteria bacterium]|nr:Do family serine endopeptidase [Deltaproteobacteria bacterium]MBW1962691.1 Do family serine endopeptidase [Deltaproteobacteria bacterium]MBW1995044.1 Do family serine endopeptidase [Deltaproteobacteria bacterium]MBW2153028.1 Do family serine endopeptidase [Deltaproteobacteria bacterium]
MRFNSIFYFTPFEPAHRRHPYSAGLLSFAVIALVIALLQITAVNSHGSEFNRETPVVRTVRKVSPAVVNISSEYEVRKRVNPFSAFDIDPFFDSFFKDFFEHGIERRYKRNSLGSGVIIDGNRGYILTNAHVLEKTATITVTLKDEREFRAQVVGVDPESDLAVLRIDSKKPLPSIEMGDSDDLMIGETVIAIGNPFGFSHTVTTGVISALNRSIRTENRVFQDFIQTDASINPGNSGGPLLNINGELIGINTAIYAKAQGIGFAIPINKAKRIVSDLIRYGEVIPAWIGITPQDLDVRVAQYLNARGIKGVLVRSVDEISPAKKAGIREGDLILALGARKVDSVKTYESVLKGIAAGKVLDVQIWRDGKKRTVSLKTAIFPEQLAMALAQRLLGVRVEDLSRKIRRRFSIPAKEGVVITELNSRTYLARIGVRPGDVIRQMDEIVIKNTADFKKAIVKYRKKSSVVLLVQRGNQLYYITVNLRQGELS